MFDLIKKGFCILGGLLVGSALSQTLGFAPVSFFVWAGIPGDQHFSLGILILLAAWMINAVGGGRLHPWDR
ncbi:hypothetical protein EIP75_21685 [Aquabacterium soli]|uniref:Uncharacterized protein n=1 Tax=Aquabacterium soli TaxID=2493092 RepID=A0A3R8S4J9_9BURK|nr:hypothetical protein [Aquabacterium soli]RRS01190.1 hypothetical protein EIP75_21685 [Aquabacterium soli]